MKERLRSLRIGMITATVTASFLAACGGDDNTVDTGNSGGAAGGAGLLVKDGSSDTGKAGVGGTAGAVGSTGSAGTAGSGGSAGLGGFADTAGSDAGRPGEGGLTLDGSADSDTDAGTTGNTDPDAGDSAPTTSDAGVAQGASDASSADETVVADATSVDAAAGDATTSDGGVEAAQGPRCGDGITNGTEECDHGANNSDAFYSGCTTTCQHTSLIVWLDGADPNGDHSTIADGTFMNKWVDKARGSDAVQGTTANQPSYSVAGINGVSGLVFDGSNDSLALPVDINYGVLPDITVIAVFQNAPGNPAPYAGVWGQDDGGWDRFMVSGGNGGTGISNGNGFTAVTGLTTDSVPLISVATLHSGGLSSVHVGGSLAASFTESHNNSGTTSLSIGDLNGPTTAPYGAFDGIISEVMIFDRALTAQERNALGAILSTKYGLPQYCGDGIKQGTEGCDNGTNDGSLGCNSDCTYTPYCGDGVQNGAEECDLGTANNKGTGCDADCTLSPIASILLHCDATSPVLQTFVGAGCHQLVVTGGASYIKLLTAGTQAILYPTTDCSGTVSLAVTTDLNFCSYNFNDNSGLNDQVWSAYLSK